MVLNRLNIASIDAVFEGDEKVWQNKDVEPVRGINRPEYHGTQVVFNPTLTYSQDENSEQSLLHILGHGETRIVYSRGDFEAVFTRDGTQLYELRSLSLKKR